MQRTHILAKQIKYTTVYEIPQYINKEYFQYEFRYGTLLIKLLGQAFV